MTRKALPKHIRSKNIALLAILLGLIAMFFGLSLTKLEQNNNGKSKPILALHG